MTMVEYIERTWGGIKHSIQGLNAIHLRSEDGKRKFEEYLRAGWWYCIWHEGTGEGEDGKPKRTTLFLQRGKEIRRVSVSSWTDIEEVKERLYGAGHLEAFKRDDDCMGTPHHTWVRSYYRWKE